MSLISPGVEITFTDESYYDSSTPGSVPLIILATETDKLTPAGSSIAVMTTDANAGKVRLSTSQRELVQAYGTPKFYSSGGTSIHGHELNEYGLLAAYQYLGISSRAYTLRAPVDLADLAPNDTAPHGPPNNGTFWFDVANTNFGLFQSNGNSVPGIAWEGQEVLIATDEDTTLVSSVYTPKTGFGLDGDYAIAIQTSSNLMFEKISGTWLRIGSAAWKAAHPTTITSVASPTLVSGNTFSINGTLITLAGTTVTSLASTIASATIANISAAVESNALVIRNNAGGNIIITAGSGPVLTSLGITAGTFKGVSVTYTNNASYPTNSVVGDLWVKGTATNSGSDYSLKVYNSSIGLWSRLTVEFYPFDSTLSDSQSSKDTAATEALSPVTGTIYVGYDTATNVIQFRRYADTYWVALSYEASVNEPVTEPEDGRLWYSDDFRTDIMVSNGSNWIGYRSVYTTTDPAGVLIAGSAPTVQSDGTALVENDLWIDSSDLENYPRLRRYNATTQRWALVDLTDQTSPFGIMFADARADSGVTYTGQIVTSYSYNSEAAADMLISDYVDPDAPDARTVPAGMMLFNTRYSSYNVKEWKPNYFGYDGWDADTDYTLNTYFSGGHSYTFPALADNGRWVSISGNRANGSPLMGRRAQRAVITRKMAQAVLAAEDIRSELVNFNLIAAPGYPELIDEMNTLNADKKLRAFVVADSPIRLKPISNDIQEWANNAYGAGSNGEDGLLTASEYVGIYYPWGLSTNVSDGLEVMIPPSAMALRTIAYNDQVAYPWFAPAGFQRGLVTNATSVGYLDDEGEYVPSLVHEGLRNTLYTNKINPISYIENKGLVIYGQKTRAPLASALDRINVVRLCNYMSGALDLLSKPFLFQQNDQQTRDTFKAAIERFLSGLVGLRALDDFSVLCDSSNNTRERINRNELWADIAILPTKAIEFIYIPIRISAVEL